MFTEIGKFSTNFQKICFVFVVTFLLSLIEIPNINVQFVPRGFLSYRTKWELALIEIQLSTLKFVQNFSITVNVKELYANIWNNFLRK